MRLKFAFLGAWHSHASMHVEEAHRRPDEFELLGMYDPDDEVIARRQERWAGQGGPLPVFPGATSVEAVLASDAEAVVVEGHVYQNLDYAEAALRAGKHVLRGEKPAGVDLAQFSPGSRTWRLRPACRRSLGGPAATPDRTSTSPGPGSCSGSSTST